MWLTDVSIRRPVFIIMFVLALMVLGFVSRSRMPAELTPKVDFPVVAVRTIYAGAGPNEIETLISEPIEKAVTSVGNIRNVMSTSQDGISLVAIEFELGTNLDAASADVRDKVSAIRSDLPRDAEEPSILKLDISSMPVMTIGLEGPISAKEMRILADDVITDQLAKVGGVASIRVLGGEEREISVAVDKARLDAYGMSIDEVVTAIKAANLNVPAGSIKEDTRDYSVRTVGELESADQIAAIRIPVRDASGVSGSTIRLGDIADVKDTVAEPEHLSRINGRPSVTLHIQKQSDANTVEVAEGVKRQLEEMKPVLPPGMQTIISRDDSVFVEDSLRDVNRSLMEGIFLVVVIVFLFLHTVRATFIVAIAIPTSIMATHMPIYGFGFTLNMMTLLALALVVGILVDDSIVVLENIERHLRMRKSPRKAALDGRSEIGLAAITITFVDIVVFVPVAFMGGIVGQFFRQFGITVATATAFSLLMSFTLTPMLASRWMKSEDEKEREEEELKKRIMSGAASRLDRFNHATGVVLDAMERFIRGLDNRYRGVLSWSLENRFLTWVIGFVSLLVVLSIVFPKPEGALLSPAAVKTMTPRIIVALIALGLSLSAMYHSKSKGIALGYGLVTAFIALVIHVPFGFAFFPDVDRGELSVSIRTPAGSSLVATDKVVREIEAILEEVPELKGGFYTSVVGTSGGMLSAESGPHYANIDAKCVPKSERERGIQEIVEWVARRTAAVAGAERIAVAVGSAGPSNNISLEVQGTNMDDILEEANRVAGLLAKIPGTVDIDISYEESRPERRIIVDRTRAAQFGLSVAQIATTARTAIDGDDSAKLRDSGTEYPIRVHYERSQRNKSSDVENVIVASRGGAPIYLRDVANVVYDNAPTKIDRKNRQRVVYVEANLVAGAQLGNVQAEFQRELAASEMVPGTTVVPGGMGRLMRESYEYMGEAFILAIALVYMLMGALFESFLTPFVIMFSLPQAMVGALLAILITGDPFGIVPMIGIIMLMGLVAKNAILLVDYTNTLRQRGMSRDEAVLEAGATRLRPILMTTLAMVGGMMPTALALSEGSEWRSPMAVAVIGGLLFSMLLTLIVIPVVYSVVDDAWHSFLRRFFPKAYRRAVEFETHPLGAEVGGDGGAGESELSLEDRRSEYERADE